MLLGNIRNSARTEEVEIQLSSPADDTTTYLEKPTESIKGQTKRIQKRVQQLC